MKLQSSWNDSFFSLTTRDSLECLASCVVPVVQAVVALVVLWRRLCVHNNLHTHAHTQPQHRRRQRQLLPFGELCMQYFSRVVCLLFSLLFNVRVASCGTCCCRCCGSPCCCCCVRLLRLQQNSKQIASAPAAKKINAEYKNPQAVQAQAQAGSTFQVPWPDRDIYTVHTQYIYIVDPFVWT